MGKNERNEKRKLTAALMNGIGLAVFGVTCTVVVAKVFAQHGFVALLGAAAIAVFVLHLLARAMLSGIEE